MSAYITRQPVLNRQGAVTANRLVVHARGVAPGQAAAETLAAVGDVWPDQRLVFLSLGGAIPDAGLLSWPLPENAVVEVPATALNTASALQLMDALAAAGARTCLDGYVAASALPPQARFEFVLADSAAKPSRAAAPGLMLARDLADGIAFGQSIKDGFDGAAGWFFLRSRPLATKLVPAQAQIVNLLNLVRRNAEVRDIETALKRDVTLSFRLLRYINSAGFGLACEIHSFRHAVAILGLDKLHKWLSLLLVTSSKDAAAPALMQSAVCRGRFMELVGSKYFDRHQCDDLFIAGAFSVLDALLGVPMETVLETMHLPETVSDALLQRDSVFKPFLDLALACERDSDESLATQADALQLSANQVNRAHLQALGFADRLPVA